jgi:hypothetical protein
MVSLRPGLKVLYMSGYTDDVIVDQGVLTQGNVLVQKPFTKRTLLRKVRETLDSQVANSFTRKQIASRIIEGRSGRTCGGELGSQLV